MPNIWIKLNFAYLPQYHYHIHTRIERTFGVGFLVIQKIWGNFQTHSSIVVLDDMIYYPLSFWWFRFIAKLQMLRQGNLMLLHCIIPNLLAQFLDTQHRHSHSVRLSEFRNKTFVGINYQEHSSLLPPSLPLSSYDGASVYTLKSNEFSQMW